MASDWTSLASVKYEATAYYKYPFCVLRLSHVPRRLHVGAVADVPYGRGQVGPIRGHSNHSRLLLDRHDGHTLCTIRLWRTHGDTRPFRNIEPIRISIHAPTNARAVWTLCAREGLPVARRQLLPERAQYRRVAGDTAYSPPKSVSLVCTLSNLCLMTRQCCLPRTASGMYPRMQPHVQLAWNSAPTGAGGQGTHVGALIRSSIATQSVERTYPASTH